MILTIKADLAKTVLLATTVVLLVLVMIPRPAAAEGFRLSADETSAGIGDQVIVTVRADNASGSEGGQFVLSFNPGLVRPLAVESGSLVEDAESSLYMANLEFAPGKLMYMWVTALGDTANSGVICTIIFEALQNGEALLEFGEIVIAPDGIAVETAVPGRITIGDTGVNQEESDDNNLDQEDAEEEEEEEINSEDQVNDRDNDEETAADPDSTESRSSLVIGLIVLVVLAAAGFILFRRSKKPGSRKNI
jgi:hypothetical protein